MAPWRHLAVQMHGRELRDQFRKARQLRQAPISDALRQNVQEIPLSSI